MSNPAMERFFDLLKGGKRMAEAVNEAGFSDEQMDDIVGMVCEVLDSERFKTSHYDASVARRVRRLEEQHAEQHEQVIHELRNNAKTSLELIKAVNRLVDMHRDVAVNVEWEGKVLPFSAPPNAS